MLVVQYLPKMKQVLIKLIENAPALLLAASLGCAIIQSKNIHIGIKNEDN